jgi:hypothetical protein
MTVLVFVGTSKMGVWMAMRRPVGVRVLVLVLFMFVFVFVLVVGVIVCMSMLRAVGVGMWMGMSFALHEGRIRVLRYLLPPGVRQVDAFQEGSQRAIGPTRKRCRHRMPPPVVVP